jgi:hypothetical protein
LIHYSYERTKGRENGKDYNPAISLADCQAMIDTYKSENPKFDVPFSNHYVQRGISSHPDICWRLWNLHREYYSHEEKFVELEKKFQGLQTVNFVDQPQIRLESIKPYLEKFIYAPIDLTKTQTIKVNWQVDKEWRMEKFQLPSLGTKQRYFLEFNPPLQYKTIKFDFSLGAGMTVVPSLLYKGPDYHQLLSGLQMSNMGGVYMVNKTQVDKLLLEYWRPVRAIENTANLWLWISDNSP